MLQFLLQYCNVKLSIWEENCSIKMFLKKVLQKKGLKYEYV